MIVTVKDVVGSSKKWPYPKCSCKTWIEHWKINNDARMPDICPNCRDIITKDNPFVGAHVKIVYPDDGNYYIVPVCNSCNTSGNFTFEIDDMYLVPAKKESCIMNK